MFFKLIPMLTAFSCLLLSPVQGQYQFTIEVDNNARQIMADYWSKDYMLEIYKGFSLNGIDVEKLDFNTVWYIIPKDHLQGISGKRVIGFSNNIKVQFQSSITDGDIVDSTYSKYSDEMKIGEMCRMDDTGNWSPPKAFSPKNQLQIQNMSNLIYKAVMFSESDKGWSPFYVSPGVPPGLEIIGSPVVKLGFAFGTRIDGTFVGQIQSKDVLVVDFTTEPHQTVCIKLVQEHTQRVGIVSGSCGSKTSSI